MTFYTTLCIGIFIGFFLGLIFAAVVMLGKINPKLKGKK
jgi:type III secretory pathway component EscT